MTPHARMRTLSSLFRFVGVTGSSAPGSRLLRRDGFAASFAPCTPDRSIFNSVICDDPRAVMDAWPDLDRRYRAAGVRAWEVWQFPADDALTEFLERRGHRYDGSPAAMLLDLDRLISVPLEGLEWEETRDVRAVGTINDEAYGYEEPAFSVALQDLARPDVRLYLARDGGDPVACAMACDADADCSVFCVATRSGARGRGFAGRLMTAVLLEARGRGCRTATLQSSPMGERLYRRLGFEPAGRLGLWELRRGCGIRRGRTTATP